MSWDGYIDSILGSCNATDAENSDKAAIVGMDGSVWTTAYGGKGLSVSATEAASIGNAFKGKDFSGFQAKGVWVEGLKYQFLREEDGKTLQAKMKEKGAMTMVASKSAVVLVHTKEGKQAGLSTNGATAIADYLESLGY